MPDDPIQDRITALDARTADETRELTARVRRGCWPGGDEDRSQPGALGWVRLWRPERLGTRVPACSCAAGRCAVCN